MKRTGPREDGQSRAVWSTSRTHDGLGKLVVDLVLNCEDDEFLTWSAPVFNNDESQIALTLLRILQQHREACGCDAATELELQLISVSQAAPVAVPAVQTST